MSFEENFRDELEYQGLTVKELAHKIGVKPSTLYSYISGHKSKPTADVAVKIAKGLNITVEYLMRDSDCVTKLQANSILDISTVGIPIIGGIVSEVLNTATISAKKEKTIKKIEADLRILPEDELEILKNTIKAFADRKRKF